MSSKKISKTPSPRTEIKTKGLKAKSLSTAVKQVYRTPISIGTWEEIRNTADNLLKGIKEPAVLMQEIISNKELIKYIQDIKHFNVVLHTLADDLAKYRNDVDAVIKAIGDREGSVLENSPDVDEYWSLASSLGTIGATMGTTLIVQIADISAMTAEAEQLMREEQEEKTKDE